MSGLKVLVVGASIAGPSTAYWLAKAGARVTVIERFPKLRSGGQAVDIRTAGVSVMRKMPGMETQVLVKSAKEEGAGFVREDGRFYGIIRATGNPDQQSIISEYEIFRGDLSNVLFDLTKDNKNINYIFGEQIASLQRTETEDGPIRVEFANGSTTMDYDLVVGCDGATSRTRAMGLGCGVRDYVVPTNWWTGYYSTPKDLLEGSKLGQGFNAVGGRSISIGIDRLGLNRVMLTCIRPRTELEATLPFRQALSQGEHALKEYIANHYKGVGWKTKDALQELFNSEDFYASEIVQVKLPRLYKGRFVLVGDAGYATGPTGGGTSLALAGAYMLAGEIAKHDGDLAAGLEGYEQQMRPLIKEMQKIPPLIPIILAPQTAWGIFLRNWAFAFVAWSGIVEFVQKFLGAGFGSTKDFPIPDYRWPTGERDD